VTVRIAVLASGGGSNLQALLDHLDALGPTRAAHVTFVATDRPAVGALDRAGHRGIATRVLTAAERTDGLEAILCEHGADLVVLAGYTRFIPEEVTRARPGRVLNVHPALLPAFGGTGMYGRHVHEAVIAAGVKLSGPTVHFVDEHYDHGPIIAQWPVPVWPGDSPASLAARVLEAEHALYPVVVHAVASGVVSLREGRVHIAPGAAPPAAFLLGAPDRPLAVHIAAALFADASRSAPSHP
jgi:formyltetrahydrofolate-dependent phosphoribosylglycinamide formyltransferase